VPERASQARVRAKNVAPEIKVDFMLNAFFALSRSCGLAKRAPAQLLDIFFDDFLMKNLKALLFVHD
jgi:hypothetical protein